MMLLSWILIKRNYATNPYFTGQLISRYGSSWRDATNFIFLSNFETVLLPSYEKCRTKYCIPCEDLDKHNNKTLDLDNLSETITRFLNYGIDYDMLLQCYKHDKELIESNKNRCATFLIYYKNGNYLDAIIKAISLFFIETIYQNIMLYDDLNKYQPITIYNQNNVMMLLTKFCLLTQKNTISKLAYQNYSFILKDILNRVFVIDHCAIPKYIFCVPKVLGLFITNHTINQNSNNLSPNSTPSLLISIEIHKILLIIFLNKPRKFIFKSENFDQDLKLLFDGKKPIYKKYDAFFIRKDYFSITEALFSNLLFDTTLVYEHLLLFKTLANYCPLIQNTNNSQMIITSRQLHYIFNLSFMFINETNIENYFIKTTSRDKSIRYKLKNMVKKLKTEFDRFHFAASSDFVHFFYGYVMPKILDFLMYVTKHQKQKIMLNLLYALAPTPYNKELVIDNQVLINYTCDSDITFLYGLAQRANSVKPYEFYNCIINVIFDVLIAKMIEDEIVVD
ncbi:hypothetical protein COBT_001205 [Conglomerata obtusa]